MKQTLISIRRFLREINSYVVNSINIIYGLIVYKCTGKTPEKAYFSLINLYCITNGYSNSFLAWLLKLYHPPYDFLVSKGVLGDLKSEQIATIVKTIKKNGYYVFDNLLPLDICQRLTTFSQTQECDLTDTINPDIKVSVYDRQKNAPIATTYWLREEDLIANPDIQMLMADLSILAIAQAYLETQPILDIVAMWWTTACSKQANWNSAQLYHFDMDRIKWLKFFIYLTDVTTDNGPHCYITGSHRVGMKPKDLLSRGYTRIPDKDIEKFYSKEDFIEVTAPRGTIIAGDTLCFHKGKPVQVGDRLILQIEFTNSLFGGSYQINNLNQLHHWDLYKLSQIHKRIYSKFTFQLDK